MPSPHSTPVTSIVTTLVLSLLLLGADGNAAPALADDSEPFLGLIIANEGDVTVRRDVGPLPVQEGFILLPGDTLVLKLGSTCSGFDPRGEPFGLTGPAEMIFPTTEAGGFLMSVRAWVGRQLAEWIGKRRQHLLITRSVRDWQIQIVTPRPLIPPPGGRVRSPESRFRWATCAGIDGYVLTVASADGEEQSWVAEGNASSGGNLVPGTSYAWKIEPNNKDRVGNAKWSSFEVMTEAQQEQLNLALQDLGDLHAGVLLLSSGLHEEALIRFDAAVEADSSSRAARRWRARALGEIGLYEQAYKDLLRLEP
jgi:hypothetical protein